jgi:hypothetical protein
MEEENKKKPHPTRKFTDTEDMYALFELYKESLVEESKRWPKVQYVGKDGKKVMDYPKVPLTFDDFKVFCYKDIGCIEQYFTNQDGYYTDFIGVCSRIKTEIRADQIKGAMLNMYNTSVTQRLNNLKESVEQTHVEQRLFE